MKFARAAMVVNENNDGSAAMRERLAALLEEHGVAIGDEDPDLVVSLGGDGTMLRAAQLAHAADAPLIGINLGTLGYLTETDRGRESDTVSSILRGDYEIEPRMMLGCVVESAEWGQPELVGLNEVLVERSHGHRLVKLSVTIGGEGLAAFNADGVIVATPTGSTAYALSAGGPIVSPRAECLVLVPVAAHMIFARPFVLAPDETVEIALGDSSQRASLSLDGSIGGDLPPGAKVVVRRHPRPLKLVRVAGPGFLERLRSKLNLPR